MIFYKMKSVCLLLCALFALALAESDDRLSCYSCSGKDSGCPEPATLTDLANMDMTYCTGVLATGCTKYSVNYLSGDVYTFRSCAPLIVDEIDGTGLNFCDFITKMYAPLTEGSLVKGVDCYNCTTVNCNT
ncbi:uncharacterized protein LOC109546487 [Dendroctonus ponderosae]|nr:uncharacterized protein LOC109546487 [Dendroctonus ponderosae]KAH1025346.1 hypothetical protein HUJ05_010087 [Dendroctonus ponderosae]KAH1025347.1 hypothetical protein HUJ05_010087 [Dendroctonus ponderosae]